MIALAGLLSACSIKDSTSADTSELNAIRTEAVSTYVSSLSESPAPLPTGTFTLTSLPTFTPSTPVISTSTRVPSNTCYDLLWLEDKTVPDGTIMKANEKFTKTWLVQNNGGCAWAPGFTFSLVGGDPMRGQTVVLRDPIPVGAKRELSVDLVVPSGVEGLLQSSWRLADANGDFFGDTLSVNIMVSNPTPSTPTTP